MTAALEIKPGWYRTRDGGRIEVVSEAVAHIAAAGYAWEVRRESGDVFGVTADGRYWSKWLKPEMPDDSADLIERIEDEPKAEEGAVKFRNYEYVCSVDLSSGSDQTSVSTVPVAGKVTWASKPKSLRVPDDDFHVSYGAREEIRRVDGHMYETQFCAAVKWCAARNLKLVAMHEWDGPPICSDREAMLNGKIARLEAENESLSRQLRSRELNKEPATGGKVWRWSPLV